jgi:hypothetical protein
MNVESSSRPACTMHAFAWITNKALNMGKSVFFGTDQKVFNASKYLHVKIASVKFMGP